MIEALGNRKKFKERVMSIFQNSYRNLCFLFLLICVPLCTYSNNYPESFGYIHTITEINENGLINQNILREKNLFNKLKMKKNKKLSYYLYIDDFIKSFIEIPTSNISVDSSTTSSKYLAGRAAIYNEHNEKVGTCSASFLCMQNEEGIYTDISNYLSVNKSSLI